MPTIYSVGDSVTLADKRLLRAYPRIVKELTDADEKLDRLELDGFLKLLPGAVERFESNNAASVNAIDPSVLSAIDNLVQSFGSRTAVSVDTDQPSSNSNTDLAFVETDAGASEPELPNGSDTSQAIDSNAFPQSVSDAAPGSGGEVSAPQASPQKARVARTPKLSGRARYRARLQELAESAGDRG